ncbi:MAG: helix-turn-helix transcriptional regulator [Leucobacter sp.]
MKTISRPVRRRPTEPRPATLTDAGLGAVIRAERRRQNLHQDGLAAASGIDPRVFSRIERGERSCRVSELSAISTGLGVTSEELLARAQERHRAFGDAGT